MNMRAKEYITLHRNEIKNIDLVEKIINELKPLRLSKQLTDDYYNRILSADFRKQSFLLQMELHKKNNAMQQEEPSLETYEGEVPYELAAEVRESLFKILKEDKSYGYIFFQLGNEHNTKHNAEPVDCIPNPDAIIFAISENRDNYPHTSIEEYLDDEFNYYENEELLKNGYTEDDDDRRLAIFNLAYQIYDNTRCVKHSITQAKRIIKSLDDSEFDTKDVCNALVIADNLITAFSMGDNMMDRVSNEISKYLKSKGFIIEDTVESLTSDDETDNQKKGNSKIKTVILLELLKKINKGSNVNDMSKICNLIAYLIGASSKKTYNNVTAGIQFTQHHKNELESVNSLLSNLNIDIKLETDKIY